MGALPRDSGKISIGDGDQQIAPEKEGVSIFFGRSSIETVKSFAVNRCNSIPKEFEEDLARAPSTGSVARKAAFFDHYIRSVSLEKKVASVEEEEEDCQGEDEEEEEQEHLEQPRDDPVEDQLDQVAAEEEEDEEQRDLAECPTDPAAEEMANDEEQEQDLFASTLAAAAAVPEEQGTMNPFKDGEVDGDEAEEESTTRPAIKSEELNAAIEKPEKNSCSASASAPPPAPAPAPAPASASAAASRRRNLRTTTRGSEQVINKWKSKQGLIPGFRAAQVTSKTATEQSASAGRKAVVAASSSSKGGRTKNNSETAAAVAAAGAAAAAAAAVAKSPVDDEPNAIRRPSSNPRDRDRSGRSIGSGAANGFTFRSNERAEKRKEFNRRMEAKQSAKEAEKNKMQAKTQEEMQAEIKELRRGLNFKATPMPGFYQEQPSTTKSAPDVRKQPVHHHARSAKPVPPSDVHRPSRQQRNDIGKLKKAAGGRTTTSSAIAVS